MPERATPDVEERLSCRTSNAQVVTQDHKAVASELSPLGEVLLRHDVAVEAVREAETLPKGEGKGWPRAGYADERDGRHESRPSVHLLRAGPAPPSAGIEVDNSGTPFREISEVKGHSVAPTRRRDWHQPATNRRRASNLSHGPINRSRGHRRPLSARDDEQGRESGVGTLGAGSDEVRRMNVI